MSGEFKKAAFQAAHASEAHEHAKKCQEALREIDVDFLLEDATKEAKGFMVQVVDLTYELAEYAKERLKEVEGGGHE